jgi:hypothetical protein
MARVPRRARAGIGRLIRQAPIRPQVVTVPQPSEQAPFSCVFHDVGHARPSITLDVYAHEFEQAQHADDVAAKLTAAFGGIL